MRRTVISALRRAYEPLTAWGDEVRRAFAPPPWSGYRPTPRRMLNLYLNRLEHRWVRTRLWSRPTKLIIEPVNACNLRCPCCFTGAGGQGRARSVTSMELFRSLLDELGDYVFELEAFNWGEPLLSPWGEPLLSPHIYAMVAEATARGIATRSIPTSACRSMLRRPNA